MRGAVVRITSGELSQSVFICQDLNVSSGTLTCNWDYPIKPGTQEWMDLTLEEQMAACQIPENALNTLSTACLTERCLQYPFINTTVFSFNYMTDGFNKFYEDFNGIRELYNREKP